MMNSKNTGKWVILAFLLSAGYTNVLLAQESESLLNFKFNHLSTSAGIGQDAQVYLSSSKNALSFAQIDATWIYPWETKNINFDLGVTLRHLSGFKNASQNSAGSYFQEVMPLLHASALFSLPLKGLTAGINGSHLDSNGYQVFDYRANVSYEWRKGFGLQGGWQHQQFRLDNATDSRTSYEANGPFIDFYLDF